MRALLMEVMRGDAEDEVKEALGDIIR